MLKKLFKNPMYKRIGLVILFALIATALLLKSFAAISPNTIEPEAGTATTGANKITDASVSNGGYISFNGTTGGTGTFRVIGKDVIGPDGNKFKPIGANVGAQVNTGFCPYAFTGSGCAQGHSADALDWGWNTIRLDVPSTGDNIIGGVQQVIDEYTAKKIVVIVTLSWDFTGTSTPFSSGNYAGIINQWTTILNANKNNSYVWSNFTNEPFTDTANGEWANTGTQIYNRLRPLAPNTIFVWDLPVWGQDLQSAVNGTGAAFLSGKTNMVLSWHNYTVYDAPTMTSLAGQANQKGIPIIIGEFGYPYNGDSQNANLSPASMQRASDWTMDANNYNTYGFGAIWWHATGSGDNLTLRQAKNSAWFNNSLPLSAAGIKLRALAGK